MSFHIALELLLSNNTCAATCAQRRDVVCGGEVQRGSGDVHHLVVVIIVTGVMKAVKAPGAVAGVFHPFKP